MTTDVVTYVPDNVNMLISGYKIDGWNKITISRKSPAFLLIRGLRGSHTRVRNPDTSCNIEIEVYQTSVLNDVLSKVLQIDMTQGQVRMEMLMQETTNTGLFVTASAFVTGYPEVTRGATLGTVTWKLETYESIIQIGSAKSGAVGVVQGAVSKLKDFANKAEGLVDKVGGIIG